MNMVESEQVNFYFRAAMNKYELEQSYMNAGRSVNRHPEPEIDMPDINMESVVSRPNGSHDYDHALREQGGKRLPEVATTREAESGNRLTKRFECLPCSSLRILRPGEE